MTQKEIEMLLANTKVYVNGKSREIQEKLFSLGYKWNGGSTDISNTGKPFLYIFERKAICHGDDMEYFIRGEYREITAEQILSLEVTEPSYRPFRNKEECWQEMLKHKPFGWLRLQECGNLYHIGNISKFGNVPCITFSTHEKESITLVTALETYTFADGIPFGIKEE